MNRNSLKPLNARQNASNQYLQNPYDSFMQNHLKHYGYFTGKFSQRYKDGQYDWENGNPSEIEDCSSGAESDSEGEDTEKALDMTIPLRPKLSIEDQCELAVTIGIIRPNSDPPGSTIISNSVSAVHTVSACYQSLKRLTSSRVIPSLRKHSPKSHFLPAAGPLATYTPERLNVYTNPELEYFKFFPKDNRSQEEFLRSTQLVYSYRQGKLVPRLKEPRPLLGVSASAYACQQHARWPFEIEVLPERIKHIPYIPSEREPFYKPTGLEKTPLARSHENVGTVVYRYDPVLGQYYTKSQTGGGRPVLSRTVPVNIDVTNDETLIFESRFECGNLQKAVKIGDYEYELWLRTDLYTQKHTQWFYFRISNTRKCRNYRFTIVNFMKSDSLYNKGMRPLLYSEKKAQDCNIGWTRAGKDIKYYRNNIKNPFIKDRCYYSLTWTCQFEYDQDIVFFTHCYPYTYTDFQDYLRDTQSDPVKSKICKHRVLCRSLAGNFVHLLTITSPYKNPDELKNRKGVVVTARVHPGETNASWMMKGFLDFVLSNNEDAKILRDNFIFKVVPILNPDGVIVGNYRCSLTGRDLNRNYRSMLKESFPSIYHTKIMVKSFINERNVVLYCDLHGHSRKNNVFIYGCENKGSKEKRFHERVFPLMMGKNAPDKFEFRSCKFKVQKSKEGTGRIVMWNMGIMNSFTMEATFSGSSMGKLSGFHFTTADFESLGYHFCDTLLDYCDPDNTKQDKLLLDLEGIMKQELIDHFKKTGKPYDPDKLDLDAYDLEMSSESSDGGSDSSVSDGLPMDLQYMINKAAPPKKKRLKTKKERDNVKSVPVLAPVKSRKAETVIQASVRYSVKSSKSKEPVDKVAGSYVDQKDLKGDQLLDAVTSNFLKNNVITKNEGTSLSPVKSKISTMSSKPQYMRTQPLFSCINLNTEEKPNALDSLPPGRGVVRGQAIYVPQFRYTGSQKPVIPDITGSICAHHEQAIVDHYSTAKRDTLQNTKLPDDLQESAPVTSKSVPKRRLTSSQQRERDQSLTSLDGRRSAQQRHIVEVAVSQQRHAEQQQHQQQQQQYLSGERAATAQSEVYGTFEDIDSPVKTHPAPFQHNSSTKGAKKKEPLQEKVVGLMQEPSEQSSTNAPLSKRPLVKTEYSSSKKLADEIRSYKELKNGLLEESSRKKLSPTTEKYVQHVVQKTDQEVYDITESLPSTSKYSDNKIESHFNNILPTKSGSSEHLTILKNLNKNKQKNLAMEVANLTASQKPAKSHHVDKHLVQLKQAPSSADVDRKATVRAKNASQTSNRKGSSHSTGKMAAMVSKEKDYSTLSDDQSGTLASATSSASAAKSKVSISSLKSESVPGFGEVDILPANRNIGKMPSEKFGLERLASGDYTRSSQPVPPLVSLTQECTDDMEYNTVDKIFRKRPPTHGDATELVPSKAVSKSVVKQLSKVQDFSQNLKPSSESGTQTSYKPVMGWQRVEQSSPSKHSASRAVVSNATTKNHKEVNKSSQSASSQNKTFTALEPTEILIEEPQTDRSSQQGPARSL